MIDGREQHAQTEADEQTDDEHLITECCMFAQKLKVKDRQANEENATSQVTPDVDLRGRKSIKNKALD